MVAHASDGREWVREDECALGPFSGRRYSQRCAAGQWTEEAHLYCWDRAMRGLLASVASLVPELRPLVIQAAESPLTIPAD